MIILDDKRNEALEAQRLVEEQANVSALSHFPEKSAYSLAARTPSDILLPSTQYLSLRTVLAAIGQRQPDEFLLGMSGTRQGQRNSDHRPKPIHPSLPALTDVSG